MKTPADTLDRSVAILIHFPAPLAFKSLAIVKRPGG